MLLNRQSLCVNTIKPSPLHRAVRDSDLPTIDRLLEDPSIDINKNVYYWDTALHLAVRNSNIPLILKLLDRGAKIDELSFAEGYRPLHIAVINKNLEIVELLLTRGANVNGVSTNFIQKYWTPLHFAISQSNYPLIDLLFRFNADINGIHFQNRDFDSDDPFMEKDTRDCYYKTPLHIAVEYRQLATVRYLLDLDKIDINAVDSTFAKKHASLLYVAVRSESRKITRLLLDGGIDVNAVNGQNSNVLVCAKIPSSNENYLRPSQTNFCIDILKRHLVKLDVINYNLIEQNIAAINDGEFDSFRKKCLQEIEFLKTISIKNTNLTYSRALFQSKSVLAVYVKNIDEEATDYDDLVNKLPIYGGIIYFRLKQALKRSRLVMEAQKIIFDIFGLLPNIFLRDLFLYLSNEDLKIIIA